MSSSFDERVKEELKIAYESAEDITSIVIAYGMIKKGTQDTAYSTTCLGDPMVAAGLITNLNILNRRHLEEE